jgi:hypothetical protein
MYHGRHRYYRAQLCGQYSARLPMNLHGTKQTNERAIRFYKWFYAQIQPCGCRGTMRGSWLRRMEALYCRDLKRLRLKTVKIEGALSSLCEIRGMDPPDAWKAYLLRWGGSYSSQLPSPYSHQIQHCEPEGRRFSLRVAEIEPIVFGFHGYHSPARLGCWHCDHRAIGCTHCFAHNKLSYGEAAIKNLKVILRNHSKCRGRGCRICYNRARKAIRSCNIQDGLYPSDAQRYRDWLRGM